MLINPDQQITRAGGAQALHAATTAGSCARRTSSARIEVGKLADLVVLNQDYFTVPDEELKRIRSVLTIVGGNIVHDAKVLRVERETGR